MLEDWLRKIEIDIRRTACTLHGSFGPTTDLLRVVPVCRSTGE
jgi:hypothetical protein